MTIARFHSVSASRAVVLAAIGVLVFSLGIAADALAALPQTWTFTVTIPRPGAAPATFPITNVVVTSTSATSGAFTETRSFPPVQGCPQGFRFTLQGTMTSVMALTGSSPDPCTEISQAIPFSAPLTPAPFPNATSFSGSVPGFAGFAVSGTCNTNCAGSPTSPGTQVAVATAGALQAAALGSVAVITTNVQTFNIGLRLAALRRGAPGVSASGLSLDMDGQSVPLAAATSFLERGGGASADRSRLGLFVNGKGSFGTQDATSKDAGFDFNTAGVTVGADYRFTDQFLLGMALGYLRTKTAFDASAGESRIHGYSVSAYGNVYLTDKWYLDGIATFGWNDYDTERAVTPIGATAEGSTDGTQFALSVSTGYNFDAGGLTFGPTARANYVRVHIDGYRDRGAAPFDLTFASQDIESLTSALGGQASYAISLPWGILSPQVRFEWEHEFKGDSRTMKTSFIADPATVVAVRTGAPDRDYFNLGASLSATLKGGVSAFVAYDVVLGRSNFINHAFNAGVRFEF